MKDRVCTTGEHLARNAQVLLGLPIILGFMFADQHPLEAQERNARPTVSAFTPPARPGALLLWKLSQKPQTEVRRFAAQALAKVREPEIIHAARALINDVEPEIRQLATESICHKKHRRYDALFQRASIDKDRAVRQTAARCLGGYPHPNAQVFLGQLIGDPEPVVRLEAMRALSAKGTAGQRTLVDIAFPPGKATSASAQEAETVLHSIAAEHGEHLVPLLHFRGQKPQQAQRIAHLLAKCGVDGIESLLDTLQQGQTREAFYARRALGNYAEEAAISILVRLRIDSWKDLPSSLVVTYLEMLSKSRPEGALDVLAPMARSRQSYIRSEAIRAISAFPASERTTQILMEGLVSPDPTVRTQAALGLGRQRAPEAVRPLIRLAAAEDRALLPAIDALGEIGDRRAVLLLHRHLRHHRSTVRTRACKAVASINHQISVRPLMESVEDPEPMVRYCATRALKRLLEHATVSR